MLLPAVTAQSRKQTFSFLRRLHDRDGTFLKYCGLRYAKYRQEWTCRHAGLEILI